MFAMLMRLQEMENERRIRIFKPEKPMVIKAAPLLPTPAIRDYKDGQQNRRERRAKNRTGK